MYGVTVENHHHTRLGSPSPPPLLFGREGAFIGINTEKAGCDFIFVGWVV